VEDSIIINGQIYIAYRTTYKLTYCPNTVVTVINSLQ
jgi:hypothetical protein